MTNEDSPANKNGSNSRRNRIIIAAITALGLMALFILLGNPGLFVPPNGNAEAENQPPPQTTDNDENNTADSSTNANQENVSYNATNENKIPIISDNSSSNISEPLIGTGNGNNEVSPDIIKNDGDNNNNNNNDNTSNEPDVSDEDDTVIVIVHGSNSNHRPVAIDGSVRTDMNTAVVLRLNASDSDGDTLTYIVLTNPLHGSLTESNINSGEVMYTPDTNYQGTDHFTFRVNDGKLDSVAADVEITVIDTEGNDNNSNESSNHAPQVSNIEVQTGKNKAVLVDLIGNTTDVDSDSVSFTIIDMPTNGIAELNDNGTVTYVPNSNYVGSDSFTYQANDGTADSNVGQVSVTITETYVLQMEDNTFSYGVELYSGKPSTVENVGPQSVLIGKDINTIILWLSKTGNPEGQIEVGVFNDDLSVKKLFGAIEVTDITEEADNPGQYRFNLAESDQPYTIQEGDRIGIKFTGGDISNFIAVQVDDDASGPFDGSNTYKSFYETDWVDIEKADLSMTLLLSN